MTPAAFSIVFTLLWISPLPIPSTHLARPEAEGGSYLAPPPHVFLHWLHSRNFITTLQEPQRFDAGALATFRQWAASVGLVLDLRFLRYMQLAPVRHSSMGFLAWYVRSFSLARSEYQSLPLPLSYDDMPVWHNVLVTSKSGQTYYSPKLVRSGKLLYCHVFGDVGVHANVRKHIATTWRGRYDLLGVALKQPPQQVPKGEERWDLEDTEDTWPKGWQKQAMLRRIMAKQPHEARQEKSVWVPWWLLKLPPADLDFIQKVLWCKLQLGGGGCAISIQRISSVR